MEKLFIRPPSAAGTVLYGKQETTSWFLLLVPAAILISPIQGGRLRPHGKLWQPYKEHFNFSARLSAKAVDAIPPAHRRENQINPPDVASPLRASAPHDHSLPLQNITRLLFALASHYYASLELGPSLRHIAVAQRCLAFLRIAFPLPYIAHPRSTFALRYNDPPRLATRGYSMPARRKTSHYHTLPLLCMAYRIIAKTLLIASQRPCFAIHSLTKLVITFAKHDIAPHNQRIGFPYFTVP